MFFIRVPRYSKEIHIYVFSCKVCKTKFNISHYFPYKFFYFRSSKNQPFDYCFICSSFNPCLLDNSLSLHTSRIIKHTSLINKFYTTTNIVTKIFNCIQSSFNNFFFIIILTQLPKANNMTN